MPLENHQPVLPRIAKVEENYRKALERRYGKLTNSDYRQLIFEAMASVMGWKAVEQFRDGSLIVSLGSDAFRLIFDEVERILEERPKVREQ